MITCFFAKELFLIQYFSSKMKTRWTVFSLVIDTLTVLQHILWSITET